MKVNRRQILALLACIPASAAIGGGFLGWRWWDVAPGQGLLVLSDDEYGFVQALAEAWMPPGGEPAVSGRDADVGRYLDEVMSRLRPMDQKLLKVLMQTWDDRPRIPYLLAFQDLDLETRIGILQGWMASDHALTRTATQAILLLFSEGFATHPDVIAVMKDNYGCWYGR